jgi:uncharacterized membrane protein (GlpM family)
MTAEKKPKLEDYFAGAALANSLVWLTLGITTLSETNSQNLAILSPLLYVTGATISGYLVSRKATQNHLKIGLKTGLAAFVFHVYVFVGLFELFLETNVLSLADHLLIFAILIAGAVLGSFLRMKFSSTKGTDKSVG